MCIRNRLYLLLMSLILITTMGISSLSCSNQKDNKLELKVIMAGSLLVPFQALEKQYEIIHPDIDVLLEGHGSVQVIRGVTELGYNADLAAVADAQLIPLMMYSARLPENAMPYADWCLSFSTNKLGIAYQAESAYSSEINADNWYEVMSRPDVKIGLADPRIDALGYRTLMAIQLAESHYHDSTIFERLLGSAFNTPIKVVENGNIFDITIPELVKPAQKRVSLRSYSIQLLALLESGDIDYSFEYESVAKQRGLRFLSLPQDIDLSSQEHTNQYQKVVVNLNFQRFSSVMPKFYGAQIVYGITIPANASHPQEASEFLEFLLGTEGNTIFSENNQPLLATPACDNIDALPLELKSLFH